MTKFDITVDPTHGVRIVATVDPLTAACLLPSEIDSYVADLKADLDAVAERAKQAILSMSNLPDLSEPH